MNKKDLDALNELYSSVYGSGQDINEMGQAGAKTTGQNPSVFKPTPGAGSAGASGSGGRRGTPGASPGRLRVPTASTRRLPSEVTGVVDPKWDKPGTPVKKPASGLTAPVARQAIPTVRPSGTSARPPAAPTGVMGKVSPSSAVKPATPSGQTGDKAKDMATWAKANPKLAAAAAERERTRGTSSTTNPLMRNMKTNLPTAKPISQSYEWSTAKTIRDIADAYSSIYESKKKVDQDQDGDNDFADVRIARMIASGVPKEKAIAMTKNKSYNKEEVELVDEKYMGFKALKASIAAKGGVRDPGAVAASIGRKKYGKKKFQAAAAKGHKLGEEIEIVASYLLENNFASTIEDANVIIENMSENWFVEILEDCN